MLFLPLVFWVNMAVAQDINVNGTSDSNSLALALNTPNWIWHTNAVGWFSVPGVAHDGFGAAQSASFAAGQTSSMETTVTGPGKVRFWWKCASADSGNKLRFYVNGSQSKSISGNKDWQIYTAAISGSGTQDLRWDYAWSSGSSASGATGWVDQVEFGRELPPLITSQPASSTIWRAAQRSSVSW
jgi:hypothetical protein